MEEWETTLDGYPDPPDVRCFIKMLKTAEVVLKGDLAEFEIEWIIDTLFYEPVNLLKTMSSKRNEAPWSKPISDAFKLIGEIVTKFPVEHLCDDVVQLCNLPYSPQIRKDAINTLTRVCSVSATGAQAALRHVDELEQAATGKAPLALLVGTIAEHYPEEVADMAPRIWRVYLNLLETNKNTDTVINAVLQGLLKLLKNFGQELPTAEFRDLYEKLTNSYLLKGKCEEVCLTILEHHSGLFKELLAKDTKLRGALWQMRASAALRAIYAAVATAVDHTWLQKISDSELVPRATSQHGVTKHTALRVLRHLIRHHQVTAEHLSAGSDMMELEHTLRGGNVSYDDADAIQWCVESGDVYSDRLLQSAILFYHHIPSSKRREVIVYGLLNAQDDVRNEAIALLVSESSQCSDYSSSSIEKYLPLWCEILDSKKGTDALVLEKSRLIFNDLLEYFITVLEALLEEMPEIFPTKLSPLLTLAYHILTIYPQEDYTMEPCRKFMKLLHDLHYCTNSSAAVLYAATAAAKHAQESLAPFCKLIRVDRCRDEALLCAACVMVLDAADGDEARVLQALEVLFARRDADPDILSKALIKFEDMLQRRWILDESKVNYIISLIKKLRSRKDVSKEGRCFHRRRIIFLGKYGKSNSIPEVSSGDAVLSGLKEKLILIIPNPDEGVTYKLNLQRILQLAIVYEEPDALQKLLAIVCASLSVKRDPQLEAVLPLLIRSLCRALAAGGGVAPQVLVQAGAFCRDQVTQLIQFISEEKSPGVRRMLSDMVEGVLMSETSSEESEKMATAVADRVYVMLRSDDATVRSGGLSVAETLLSALNHNHLLQKNVLPDLLTAILDTQDLDARVTFRIAYKMLIDNLEIYDEDIVYGVVEGVIGSACRITKDADYSWNMLKNYTKLIVEFCKGINKLDYDRILSFINVDKDFRMALCFLADLEVGYKEDLFRNVLGMIEGLGVDTVSFYEEVSKFLVVYSTVLLNEEKEMTMKIVGEVIRSSNSIINISQLERLVSAYRDALRPDTVQEIFQFFYTTNNYQEMVNEIVENGIIDGYKERFRFLNRYMMVLNVENVCDTQMAKLPYIVYDRYKRSRERFAKKIDLGYTSDLLDAGLRCQKRDSFVVFLNEIQNVEFVEQFIGVFAKIFVEKPFVLIQLPSYVVVVKTLLRHVLKKKTSHEHENLLHLIDALWPVYQTKVPPEELYSVLKLVKRLAVQPHADSELVAWVKSVCEKPDEGSRLLDMLPGGEGCSATYRKLASTLPARLSELSARGRAMLQAILDGLSATGDPVLLDIVMKMAHCDPSKGWWDEAMASCMGIIASRGDTTFKLLKTSPVVSLETRHLSLMSIAKTLFEFPSMSVCHRLLIPLLRYASTAFCEHFFSTTVNRLLSTMMTWPRDMTKEHYEHHRILEDHVKALALITIAFEKVPLTSLKSPDSNLYREVEKKQPSYLLKRASAVCVALRDKQLPEDASMDLKRLHRDAMVENYKCLSAAVCLSRPAEKFYDFLFSNQVWVKLVDQDAIYKLPLQSQWHQRRSVVATVSDARTRPPAGPRSGDVRTRVFLRTLSDDPLRYDLTANDDEPAQENTQELELLVNELNELPVTSTLTALLRHVASLDHANWKGAVTRTLDGTHRNLRWILAQVICNCKEELKPFASDFLPALLALVANTALDEAGRKTLNSLHIDVLETVLYWQHSNIPESSSPHIKNAIEYLINTALDHERRPSVLNQLLSLLNRVGQIYSGKDLDWEGLEDCLKAQEKLKALLRVLLTLLKHKIYIPQLLPILAKLDAKYWSQESRLDELFGAALACSSETSQHQILFRRLLDKKRQINVAEFVKMLYYSQMYFPGIVDEFNFKMITDLTPKLVTTNQSRCLHIIAAYLQTISSSNDHVSSMFETIDITALIQDGRVEALSVAARGYRWMGDRLKRQVVAVVSGCCMSSDVKVRRAAFEVVTVAFIDLFGPKLTEPASKRPRLTTNAILDGVESSDTLIRKVIECAARGVTDCDAGVAGVVRQAVGRCLGSDMGVRLSVSFLLSICIPATLTGQRDLTICVSSFLELMFGALRSMNRFPEMRLMEQPLKTSEPSAGPSKLLTNLRTYQGTFIRTTGQQKPKAKETEDCINVQLTIEEILTSLMQFAKGKTDVSSALCVQVVKSFLGPGFDSRRLCAQACDALSVGVGELTPLAVAVVRMVLDVDYHGIENSLQKLMGLTKRTAGEALVSLLYEDYRIRKEPDLFILGVEKYEETNVPNEYQPTSLEDIISAFGKLSDWDKLTIQQRSDIRRSGIPQVWVDDETFKSWIDVYQVADTKSWFDQLVAAYRDDVRDVRWLRQVDRWPQSSFRTSVVVEALERNYATDLPSGDWRETTVRSGDCLVEWAARIMLRRAYASSAEDSLDVRSRSNLKAEYNWCEAALDQGLPHLAVNCLEHIEPKTDCRYTWSILKSRALKALAEDIGTEELVHEAFKIIEHLPGAEDQDPGVVMGLCELRMQLAGSMTEISGVSTVKHQIEKTIKNIPQTKLTKSEKTRLSRVYELALTYYGEAFVTLKNRAATDRLAPKDMYEVLKLMVDVISHSADTDPGYRTQMLMSVLFNTLDEVEGCLDEDTARHIIDKLSPHLRRLDTFSVDEIKARENLFPPELFQTSSLTDAASVDTCRHKQYLRLVRDPRHSLLQVCGELKNRWLNDAEQWKRTFALMKGSFFENPYSIDATEYRLLTKYKKALYQIEDYENTTSTERKSTLEKTLQELVASAKERETLRLSQLCPALARYRGDGSEGDRSMSRLLGLGSVGVVKFEDQVSVFTDAISRPIVLVAICTDGVRRRWLHKSGDRLQLDAAAQRVARAAAHSHREPLVYQVTPLGEDSGLIEYVENSERLRSLIKGEIDLGEIDIGSRAADQDLILSSSSLELFKKYCSQVPPYTLRSAIERNCLSVEDFIRKKKKYTDTLSDMTVLTSILGLGDRHLENILYSQDGGLFCVDWAAMFQYGSGELPPARLTRNLLAVCDLKVLESNMQMSLCSLRASHKLFLNVIKVSFKWMGAEFDDKYKYIEMLVSGRATSRDITAASLAASARPFKERHRKLLDEVIGAGQESYSVVDQVNCLLRQCTDPRILCVTKSGWEPWI